MEEREGIGEEMGRGKRDEIENVEKEEERSEWRGERR